MPLIHKAALPLALMVSTALAHGAPSDIRDVAAAILPVPLIAEYTCGAFAEAEMRPAFVARWSDKVRSAASPRTTLKEALTEYVGLMRSFCDDVQSAFKGKDALVVEIYAAQLPGFDTDMSRVLGDPKVMSWLKRETDFLRKSVVLGNAYRTAKVIAPDLFGPPDPFRVKHVEYKQLMEMSTGTIAQMERFDLITLLRDPAFIDSAPKGFDEGWWRTEEKSLREEGSGLAWKLSFNSNANELTRRYVLSEEYQTRLGLAPIRERHLRKFRTGPQGK
jgi:hypothetical protein